MFIRSSPGTRPKGCSSIAPRRSSVHWPPQPEDRAAWSTAGGVVMSVAAGSGITWLVVALGRSSTLPTWPVYIFAGIAAFGLFVMSASLLRWGPWGILPTFALGVATLPERIEHRLIRLSEDLPAGLSPMGHTFEDCQIVGPAHVLFGECPIQHSTWIRAQLAIMPDELLLRASKRPTGLVGFGV